MGTDYFLQNVVVFWSLLLGCFLCAVYDILRIFRLGRSQNPLLLFVLDVLFCLFASLCFSVLFFNLTFGRMRAYAFVFGLLGFVIWRLTVSRLFVMILLKIRAALNSFVNKTKSGIQRFIKSCICRIYTKLYCQKAIRAVKHGFGFNKKIRKEN